MRFLHIADLHLGKVLGDVSLLDQQRDILDRITSLAEERKADAILIAGDVYQRTTPPAEAAALFNDFICSLAEKGIKVFLISGNHDSAERVSYFSTLVRSSGVYISEEFQGLLQCHTIEDEFGKINLYLLPFFRPFMVKKWLPEEKITCSQDAMKAILKQTPLNKKERNILLSHQFITGAECSDSEDVTVGGLDGIEASVLTDFDYVALGHIHKPQKMGYEQIRYAGSPLKYSFSEAGTQKGAILVELQEKGELKTEFIPLYPSWDLRIIDGKLDELLAEKECGDFVWIRLHDEQVSPNAKAALAKVYPRMLKMTVENSKSKLDMSVRAKEKIENKSVRDLFIDFYRLQNGDATPSEEYLKVLDSAMKKVEEESL